MDFIHFGNTIFRKEDFQSAWMEMEKNRIVIVFTEKAGEDDLFKKCENKDQAKDLMHELLVKLNSSND